jgi:hypothetical protein
MVPSEHLADQLRSAYDCYLEIQRHIEIRKTQALQRRSEDLTAALLCPPCFYELSGEIPLVPKFLAAMDGNNSLKLVDSAYQFGKTWADNRTLSSPRWLEPDEIDKYSNEVKASEARKKVLCYQT